MYLGDNSYFKKIAETRNISKAAEELFISQSSLSQYLSKLEKKLGVRLIDRNYAPLQLTQAGEVFLEYLRRLEALDDELESNLAPLRNDGISQLRLGIPRQLISPLMTSFLGEYINVYPDITVSVVGGSSLDMIRHIQNETIDLAFLYYDSETPPLGTDMKKMITAPLYLVCNQSNPVIKGRPSDSYHPIPLNQEELAELSNGLFIGYSPKVIMNRISNNYFAECGIVPQKTMEITEMSAMIQYVDQDTLNNSFAFVPHAALATKADNLAFLSVEDINPKNSFVLLYKRNKDFNSVEQTFLDWVSQVNWNTVL